MGGLSFLSPLGFVVAAAVAAPLVALLLLERRAARIRRTLGLGPGSKRRRIEVVAALAAVGILLGLASAQPVLSITHERAARSDAEVVFVFDVSRSMAAAQTKGAPSRLDRAKGVARVVRAAIGEVPAGIAGLTDRTLPYLFPTPNEALFAAVVAESIDIEHPPPAARLGNPGGRATTLGALTSVASTGYYTPGTPHRLLIVLSDDESNPFVESSVGAIFHKKQIDTIFVRFWDRRERIWRSDGRPDVFYRPDPTSARTVQTLAAATGGRSFGEEDVGEIMRAARVDLGRGVVRTQRIDRARTPIAPWVALAALLPLGFVLRRRNL